MRNYVVKVKSIHRDRILRSEKELNNKHIEEQELEWIGHAKFIQQIKVTTLNRTFKKPFIDIYVL